MNEWLLPGPRGTIGTRDLSSSRVLAEVNMIMIGDGEYQRLRLATTRPPVS